MEAGDDAERRVVGLLAAGQHADLGAEDLLGAVDEVHAVLGLAGGRRRDDVELLGAGLIRQRAEAAEFLDGALHGLGVELARRDDAAAEAGQHLLVEQHRRRARYPLIDDQTDRVRPDVDDGQRPAILEPALR